MPSQTFILYVLRSLLQYTQRVLVNVYSLCWSGSKFMDGVPHVPHPTRYTLFINSSSKRSPGFGATTLVVR